MCARMGVFVYMYVCMCACVCVHDGQLCVAAVVVRVPAKCDLGVSKTHPFLRVRTSHREKSDRKRSSL